MADIINLEVVTPLGVAVRAKADDVQGPGQFGEFGVLPGHLPMLVALRAGVLRYRSEGKIHVIAVGSGFAEAGPDRMSVLTDVSVAASDVEIPAAKADRDDLEKQLETYEGERSSPEYEALVRRRDWAVAQLDAAREANRSV